MSASPTLLRLGLRDHDAVKAIQHTLNGVLGLNLPEDGNFDSKTFAGVVKFQDAAHVSEGGITGVVGPETLAKLAYVVAQMPEQGFSPSSQQSDGRIRASVAPGLIA